MAITVDAANAKITIKDEAKCVPKVFFVKTGSTPFACTHLTNGFIPGLTKANLSATDAFTATATVPVTVSAAEIPNLKNWNFGFIQFQEIRSLTLYYAGPYKDHGEIVITANIPQAMSKNLGRDHNNDPNKPWLRTGTTGDLVFSPKTGLVTVQMGDHPLCSVGTDFKNDKTTYYNFLRRMIDARTFHTVFSARDPQGNFQHLAYFKWTVEWDFDLQWKGGSIVSTSKSTSTSFNGGQPIKVVAGAPTDKAIAAMLKDPSNATKLGTNEQDSALGAAINGPPNRIDTGNWVGVVPDNFWT